MGKVIGKVDGAIDGGQNVTQQNGFYIIVKTYKEAYYVLATNAAESEDSVIASTGLPAIGAAGHGGYLMDKKGKEVMTIIHPVSGVISILWEVTCSYTSDVNADQAGGAGQDPTDIRPKRRTYSVKEKVIFERDVQSGDPIVTLADEPMLVEDDVIFTVLEITRYENYPWDLDINNTFVNRVNQDSFYGAPTGTVLMDDIRTDETTVNSTDYVLATYVLKFWMEDDPDSPGNFLPDTWKKKLLHSGYMFRPPLKNYDGTVIPGQYTAPENFLDAKGQHAKCNLDPTYGTLLPQGDDKNYREFWTKSKIDFDTLNLVF